MIQYGHHPTPLESLDYPAARGDMNFIGSSQPSECGQQRTLNILHAQTAAQQQSNVIYEARMSGKCEEWRD